ncbi:para-aminobenzoate synthetase, partial [Phenoliferia sp. Uapishka_3]
MQQPPIEPQLIPTTLILDFHDSYTRNVLSLFSQVGALSPAAEAFSTRWEQDGWEDRVVVVNVDSMTWDEFTTEVLPSVSCVILGPGPGSPHHKSDFSWPARLIQEFGDVLPILGICLGHQGLATAFGGSVVKAPTPRHGRISHVEHEGDALFNNIPNLFDVIQYNSLEVAKDSLPAELEVIGWATMQGDHRSVMGLRHRSRPLWGVQFHPESIASTYGVQLLSNFLNLAHSHRIKCPRSIDPTLPLPPHVLALTTCYKRGFRNLIPDVPSFAPTLHSPTWRWEQRSLALGDGGGRCPQDVFEGLVRDKSGMGEVWLDSARATAESQFSHLFNPQLTWSFTRPTNNLVVHSSPTQPPTSFPINAPHTFVSVLARTQGVLRRRTRIVDPSLPSVPIGFVGSINYEMKDVTLGSPVTTDDEPERRDSEFAFASSVLSFEHDTGSWRATALVRVESPGAENEAEREESASGSRFGLEEAEWKSWTSSVLAFFSSSPSTTARPPTSKLNLSLNTTMLPDLDEPAYIDAIDRARALITLGESYELCLTTMFRTTISSNLAASPYPLYLSLRTSNPARYSAYFHLPLSSFSILSSSPERFMKIDKEGNADMQPIKGTVRRSDDPIEDARRKHVLENDEKERAENLMIVDLSRNDLLGFCEVASVEVPKLITVETIQTVHQLVTSITGKLSPALSPFEAVGRAFPPGSMTGAPKVRACKLLEDLEGGRKRGVYSGELSSLKWWLHRKRVIEHSAFIGVFGFVAVDGTTDFSVVIRTLAVQGDQLTLGAGGAITHLSVPLSEWEEMLVKKDAVASEL